MRFGVSGVGGWVGGEGVSSGISLTSCSLRHLRTNHVFRIRLNQFKTQSYCSTCNKPGSQFWAK